MFKFLTRIDQRLKLSRFEEMQGPLDPGQHAAICHLANNLYHAVEATSDTAGRHQAAMRYAGSQVEALSLPVVDLYDDCRLLLRELWRILQIPVRPLPIKLEPGFSSAVVLMTLARHFDDVLKGRCTACGHPQVQLAYEYKQVWELLENRHLTGKQICNELQKSGEPIFEDCLKQRVSRMKKMGATIKNRRGYGYYRPDVPPHRWKPT